MKYYPVFLDLKGRRCVVVGGGPVAEGKVQGLREAGARVVVISPTATDPLARWAREGEVEWLARPYRRGDLEGAFLAIAATDDPETNRAVAEEAFARGVLVNVVDTPDLCLFIAPAVVRRGPVTVAVSTGGLSPALARRIRRSMEDPDLCRCLAWAGLADLVGEVRARLRGRNVQVPPERWQEALREEVLDLARRGEVERAREVLWRTLVGEGEG